MKNNYLKGFEERKTLENRKLLKAGHERKNELIEENWSYIKKGLNSHPSDLTISQQTQMNIDRTRKTFLNEI
jgi:hypothetical protein